VQCESCHGPGLPHVQNPDASQPLASILAAQDAAAGCGECHAPPLYTSDRLVTVQEVGTDPAAGTQVAPGSTIDYSVSLGVEPVAAGKKGDDTLRPVRAVHFSNFIIQ